MGLDMYLVGRKYFWPNWDRPDSVRKEDEYNVQQVELRLGYWRKHPNLHGLIVSEFAGGEDECQEIELDADRLLLIIDAIQHNRLPHTEGFFFGASDTSKRQREEDVAVFQKALDWLTAGDPSPITVSEATDLPLGGVLVTHKIEPVRPKVQQVVRSVIYHASW